MQQNTPRKGSRVPRTIRRVLVVASAILALLLTGVVICLDLSFSVPFPAPALREQGDSIVRGAAVVLCVLALLLFWAGVPRVRYRGLILGIIAIATVGLATWGLVAPRALSTSDLCFAAENGDLITVERALRQGVPIDGRSVWGWYNSLGDTALTKAAFSGQTAVVKYLLDHGASVKVFDGNEPLERAVASRNSDIVQLLLAHHADPNAHPFERYSAPMGPTVLCTAIQVDDVQIAKMLLDAGARPDEPCLIPPRADPSTPAEYAALCGSSGMKALLLASPSTKPTPNVK